jgi:integrase/recombinase XerD
MLETHLSSPITRQRLRTGAAAEHIDAFADWLHVNGYKPASIDNGLTSLAAWTDWMLTSGFTPHDLLSGFEACKLAVSKEQRVRYSRGDARRAWNMRFLVSRHGGSHQFPGSSSQKMLSG